MSCTQNNQLNYHLKHFLINKSIEQFNLQLEFVSSLLYVFTQPQIQRKIEGVQGIRP